MPTLQDALSERSELKERITRLEERLKASARTEEGSEPPEDFQELRTALTEALESQRVLTLRINHTNDTSRLNGDGSETITGSIARRDMLKAEINILKAIVRDAGSRSYGERFKQVVHAPIKELQAEIDTKSREYRELDNKIQAANFSIELLDVEEAATA